MIVEALREGREGDFHAESTDAAVRRSILYEDGREKPFRWRQEIHLTAKCDALHEWMWVRQIAAVESRMKDEVLHFAFINDLINQTWDVEGDQ